MSAADYHPEIDAAIDAVASASYGVGPSPFERAVVRLLGMLAKHRPAPLTEEEARAWALREVREYSGADSNYPWLALRLETALLAASRGEVPSEVRASTCPTCRGGAMVRAEGYDRDGFPHEEPCPTCCKPEVRAPERPNAFGEALGRMHRPGAIPPEVRAPQTPEVAPPLDWRPTVGARVVTVEKLTACDSYMPAARRARRPGATGVVVGEYIDPLDGPDDWIVRHDDGTEAPYDVDELRPAPTLAQQADLPQVLTADDIPESAR